LGNKQASKNLLGQLMSKTGGKHKRGARGSTEEELTLAKRANMAAEYVEETLMTELPQEDTATEEPSPT